MHPEALDAIVLVVPAAVVSPDAPGHQQLLLSAGDEGVGAPELVAQDADQVVDLVVELGQGQGLGRR